MCRIAVDEFSYIFSQDHIRKNIDPEFKLGYRVKNGQRSWTKKTAEKASKINDSFSNGLVQGTINRRN